MKNNILMYVLLALVGMAIGLGGVYLLKGRGGDDSDIQDAPWKTERSATPSHTVAQTTPAKPAVTPAATPAAKPATTPAATPVTTPAAKPAETAPAAKPVETTTATKPVQTQQPAKPAETAAPAKPAKETPAASQPASQPAAQQPAAAPKEEKPAETPAAAPQEDPDKAKLASVFSTGDSDNLNSVKGLFANTNTCKVTCNVGGVSTLDDVFMKVGMMDYKVKVNTITRDAKGRITKLDVTLSK